MQNNKYIRQEFKEIAGYKINTNKVLGSGKYGKVCVGKRKSDDLQVAVKISSITQESAKKGKADIKNSREIETMRKVKSDNLVRLYDVEVTEHQIYLFIEYCNQGTLANYLNTNPNEQKIIHRDLKPENILIHNGVYKIGDFGFARFIEGNPEQPQVLTLLGTPLYAAPQLFEDQKIKKYGNQFDIWSFGCILYEMVYGNKLHNNVKDIGQLKQSFMNIKQNKVNLPNENNQRNQQLLDMIGRMLEYSEEKRITWQQIFDSEMFKLPSEQFLANGERQQVIDQEVQNEVQSYKNFQEKYMMNNIFFQILKYFRESKQKQDHFFVLKWKCLIYYFWNYFLEKLFNHKCYSNLINQQLNNKPSKDKSTFAGQIENQLQFLDQLKKNVDEQLRVSLLLVTQYIVQTDEVICKTISDDEQKFLTNLKNKEYQQLISYIENKRVGLCCDEIENQVSTMIQNIKQLKYNII